MSATQPIRKTEEVSEFRNFYQYSNLRNYALIVIGLNMALRISDILRLKWKDVYENGRYLEHIRIREHKTGKENIIYFNRSCIAALDLYRRQILEDSQGVSHADGTCRAGKNAENPAKDAEKTLSNRYIFESPRIPGQHLSRQQAFRIVKKAALDIGIEGTISCHSLRKTFGYHAWKKGCPPALLMNIYNHSSYEVTKRYLCIEQDERDEVFISNEL